MKSFRVPQIFDTIYILHIFYMVSCWNICATNKYILRSSRCAVEHAVREKEQFYVISMHK